MKNLCIRESYKDKNGKERVTWNKIGIMFGANNKEYIKLYHIPNILISVFEQKSKSQEVAEEPESLEL